MFVSKLLKVYYYCTIFISYRILKVGSFDIGYRISICLKIVANLRRGTLYCVALNAECFIAKGK